VNSAVCNKKQILSEEEKIFSVLPAQWYIMDISKSLF
jgi:hypothetical protein